MSDLEKAEFILEMMNDKSFDVKIKEAFRLTQSYSWLFQLVTKMKKLEENKND